VWINADWGTRKRKNENSFKFLSRHKN
jgi:hypothetical protein